MTTIDPTLPYLSAPLPGIGGKLRATANHFVVEELPLYEPSGEGTHLYLNLTKSGLTTKEVQTRLEAILQVANNSVGFAGMKDKDACTTQTFSVPVDFATTPEAAAAADQQLVEKITAELPVTIHWARRHGNKLKAGHLLGNRFRITVTDLALPVDEALVKAEAIATLLRQRGLPNFFGAQRFGFNGENVEKGLALIQNKRRERNPWLRKFLISAYQSYLCNRYLTRRIELDAFDHLLLGDVAKKHETGGMFEVTDLAAEEPRYLAQEISFTAPMYGAKMWAAQAEAGALEEAIQAEAALEAADWRKVKVDGTRRYGRILLPELTITPKMIPPVAAGDRENVADSQGEEGEEENTAHNGEALEFTFVLPKGSFATVLLREFMKVELDASTGLDSDSE